MPLFQVKCWYSIILLNSSYDIAGISNKCDKHKNLFYKFGV